jgi:hypothetical protein
MGPVLAGEQVELSRWMSQSRPGESGRGRRGPDLLLRGDGDGSWVLGVGGMTWSLAMWESGPSGTAEWQVPWQWDICLWSTGELSLLGLWIWSHQRMDGQ